MRLFYAGIVKSRKTLAVVWGEQDALSSSAQQAPIISSRVLVFLGDPSLQYST